MQTRAVRAPDGVRIAYDMQGQGPALLLLHGASQDRRRWHELGYVERLAKRFTVVAVDLRGHGESDAPTEPDAYAVTRLTDDVLAVADAGGAAQFTLWGFSYGGNIGRYLAARSPRVQRFVMIGIPFGAAASGAFRERIEQMHARWDPIAAALAAGSRALTTLSDEQQAAFVRQRIPVTLAWTKALLAWPALEPAEIRCPTLWLVGAENEAALASVEHTRHVLATTAVRAQVVPGLTHTQELTEIDTVLPMMLAFSQ